MNITCPLQIKSHPGVIQKVMLLQTSKKTRNNRIRTDNRSRSNNRPGNISLASFTGEVTSVGSVTGTVTGQRSTKDQFKTFQEKVKQYVLHKFDNKIDIIIIVRDLKDPYPHVDTEKNFNTSKEEK